MWGLSWAEVGLLVLLFGVIPAVGIAAFGILTALLWRAVAGRERGRIIVLQRDDTDPS